MKPAKCVGLSGAAGARRCGVVGRGACPVYGDPAIFFRNTHPAHALKKVVKAVFDRLDDAKEAGTTIRLSTDFDGGKSHTLIALWHLANHISDPAIRTELIPVVGKSKSVKVVAVDAAKTGVPVFGAHEGIQVRSLWREIFYQLAARQGLQQLDAAPQDSRWGAIRVDGKGEK